MLLSVAEWRGVLLGVADCGGAAWCVVGSCGLVLRGMVCWCEVVFGFFWDGVFSGFW